MVHGRWQWRSCVAGPFFLLASNLAATGRAADESAPPVVESAPSIAASAPLAYDAAADRPDSPTSQLPNSPTAARPQRVIVLKTGRVVLGDVVERPGGYLVRENFGSVVVPFGQVRLTAADLPDAYRKLSRSMTEPTAGKHLELAEWCYDNRLYGSAQDQVKRALLLEPDRKDARAFLRKLQRTLETGEHPGQVSASRADVPLGPTFPGQSWKSQLRQRRASQRGEGPVSVSGLSPPTVQMFVQKVQPLLMNKCGNARCHGQAATNDFRLTPVRRGMSGFRIFTEQNLSSVLREIDNREPETSRLLTIPQGTHGGSRKQLFLGPAGEQQQALLRQWVLRAAPEQGRTKQGRREFAQHTPAESLADTVAEFGYDAKRPSAPRHDPFLKQILAEERPDAFDPEIFNRIIHANSPASPRPQ